MRPGNLPPVRLADGLGCAPHARPRREHLCLNGPMTDSIALKWYYNIATGEVTQGKDGGWDSRMGPYDSEEEARSALEIAAERTKAADAEDAAEDDWGASE